MLLDAAASEIRLRSLGVTLDDIVTAVCVSKLALILLASNGAPNEVTHLGIRRT